MMTDDDIFFIVSQVKCPPYKFRVERLDFGVTDRLFIQATLERPDVDTGEMGTGYGGKYLLSPHMTRGEIVKKCFVAAASFAEHEVREAFTYRGRQVLGPHIDIDMLWTIAEQKETRK